ncbi:hypothetical protein KSE_52050 [Kitasatospora setae KM-6054]|uniref:THIF-type NAD/FAD binding fold domain-containing protein n=2 Tax=Streptomycetaceae TaxID=2062 RepID=E4NHK2_KITSK|nr:hypothetical protein KSE_52050 [Kitasatospora setae KM-6054]
MSTWTLRLPADLARQLMTHLFPGDGDEHGAVIGATVVQTDRGSRLLARRLYLARDGIDYVAGQRGYRMLTPTFVRDRVLQCRNEGLAYLAVHCHGGTTSVGFSPADLASHERGYPALRDILGDGVVGGLVFTPQAVAGDLWLPGEGRVELDHALVASWPLHAMRAAPLPAPTTDLTYDRQSRLFGDRGQAILAGQKVGVIGVGGAGSLIVEYLARLGVGHLVIIDPDRIDRTNLPRVVGSRLSDARPWLTDPARPELLRALGTRLATPKVRVSRRVARQANPKIKIETLQDDVTRDDVALRLIDCDYLFLAADSMQARLVFNALVHQYLIPGVQVGAKVQVSRDGSVTDIFSVVRPVAPGFGCLWCNQLVNPAKLQEEALTAEQLRRQRYVQDENVHAPSVISLNAVAVAHAVDDYLLRVTGLLPVTYEPRWREFHPAAPAPLDRVRSQIPRKEEDCSECSDAGRLGLGTRRRLPTRS